jgi:parallel beta-helix repeat protein
MREERIMQKMRITLLICIITLFFAFLLIENISAEGRTLYVDKNDSGKYPSINRALAVARSGDTIFVYSDTYNENLIIFKKINLIGENKTSTIINGVGRGNIVTIIASGIVIENFTIQNSQRSGIYIFSTNNIIKSNIISNNKKGITLFSLRTFLNLASLNYNLIYHNYFLDNEIQASDWGKSFWDYGYPTGGNQWSDFDEPSEGAYDNDNDGIVDSHYEIRGIGNRDRFPLFYKKDSKSNGGDNGIPPPNGNGPIPDPPPNGDVPPPDPPPPNGKKPPKKPENNDIILSVNVVTVVGTVSVLSHRMIDIRKRNKWERKAKEKKPPKKCQVCTYYCQKKKLEGEYSPLKIKNVTLKNNDYEYEIKGKVADAFNKLIIDFHTGVNKQELKNQVAGISLILFRYIAKFLQNIDENQNVLITMHLVGGNVECEFVLKHCKRVGNVNKWVDERSWKVTVNEEIDERLGVLRNIDLEDQKNLEKNISNLVILIMFFYMDICCPIRNDQ